MPDINVSTYCQAAGANILVVEGKDDCHGIFQLASRFGIEKTFGIWAGESDTRALKHFGGLLLATEDRPMVLGIVLDCDSLESDRTDSLTRRWDQIRSRVADLGYVLPDSPEPNGTVVQGPLGLPTIGVWIMPDNASEGMFEDFLLHMASKEATFLARRVVKFAKKKGHGNFNDLHESKAAAHCFLSWQDEPGKPFGIAIKAGMFDTSHPLAAKFVAWLGILFGNLQLVPTVATESQP